MAVVNDDDSLRYRMDRGAQRFTPLRLVDAWALRHPNINRASYVIVALFLGSWVGFMTHSILFGILGGVLLGAAVFAMTTANHKRRVANGTSAQYGPPES